MHQDDREQSHEELWKSQDQHSMRISTDEVCVMARRWERKNVRLYWVLLGLTALAVAAYLRGLIRFLMNSPRRGSLRGTYGCSRYAASWAGRCGAARSR